MLLGGLSWLASTSCGGEAATATLAPSFGTLFVPLVTTGASGATYELVDGVLSLAGSETLRLTLDGASEEARLLAGPYSVTLLDGWQLYRDVDGERMSVAAALRSPNPARLQIRQGETTSFTLRFTVDGNDVALGEEAPDDDDDPQVGGTGGTSSGVDSEGPGGLLDPDDDDDDDGQAPDDGGSPDAGTGLGPVAVCDADGARCLDAIVQEASATPTLALCIPAAPIASPLGPVDVCDGRECASGAPGCAVQADASSTTAELGADGTIRIDAILALTPFQVPVSISVPLVGSIECPIAVAGTLLAAADAEPNDDAQGRITGFALADVGTNLDEVTLALATNDPLCAALEPLLPELRTTLEPQLAEAIGDSLEASLDDLAATLSCARCEAGCGVQCVAR